jgi:hypothetical protein
VGEARHLARNRCGEDFKGRCHPNLPVTDCRVDPQRPLGEDGGAGRPGVLGQGATVFGDAAHCCSGTGLPLAPWWSEASSVFGSAARFGADSSDLGD